MILSGQKIQELQGKGITIDPFVPEQVNPNSYNMRLHNELLVYDNHILDMKKKQETHSITIPETGLLLDADRLYLGRTVEYTETHSYVPMLEGRSSLGRLGLFVHITAGFGDIGFCGYWTLEIFCVQPIRIYPHVEICQIFYYELNGDYIPYKSKYQHNTGIQSSHLYTEFTDKTS